MNERLAAEEIAAQWLSRRGNDDWSEQDEWELDRWLNQSVRHQVAFWRLEHAYAQLDRLPAAPAVRSGRSRLRRWLPMLAASLAIIASGAAYVHFSTRTEAVTLHYATGMGEVGDVALPDGTHIKLNTNTQIRVEQGWRKRQLWIERGEVYFEVAKDADRPFVIDAGRGLVTVVGTKFSVRRMSRHVRVEVVEGIVRLQHPLKPSASVLTAGDIAQTDGTLITVRSADVDDIFQDLAWRSGMVSFRSSSLADAAEDFNRYNQIKIQVHPNAAQIKISGLFRLGNVMGFSRILRESYNLKVVQEGGMIKISSS